MTLKRPRSTTILGGLLLLCNSSFTESRLSVPKHASRRELEQYYDFEDEETEGVGGQWGDYESDPLDPKPSELPLDEDDSPLSETDKSKQSATGSGSGTYKGGKDSKESSSSGGSTSTNSHSTSSASNSYTGGKPSIEPNTHSSSSSSSTSNSYTGGYSSGAKNSNYNTDSASNYRGYSSTGSGMKGESSFSHATHGFNTHTIVNLVHVKVPLFPVLLLVPVLTYFAMLWTAFQYQNRPEGVFVNCCRLSVHTTVCIAKV